MKIVNKGVQDQDDQELDVSISAGINIYSQPRENSCRNRTSVEMPYGLYFGGDISTGGGEPVGADKWLAWRSPNFQSKPA